MSERIVFASDVKRQVVDKSDWTVVIPAAGRGSRLKYDKPKVLYPVNGKPILFWLLKNMEAVASNIIVIVSPHGHDVIQEYLEQVETTATVQLLVQPVPDGMASAIQLAQDKVKTKHVMVVWGDQVLLSQDTILSTASRHMSCHDASFTFPTVMIENPYINVVRNGENVVIAVQQKREGEITVSRGENDCGLFAFNRDSLFAILNQNFGKRNAIGANTGEFNLIQILPDFDKNGEKTYTVRITDPNEVIGINTVEQAEMVSAILKDRING